MKRFEIALTAGLLISLIITPVADFAKRCDHNRQNVLRLHILANSDDPADQQLKYKVRDKIIESTSEIFCGDMSLEQMEATAQEALPKIVKTANDTLIENGSSQRATAQLKKLYFGTRSYNGVIFPAGRYEAVQVLLGEGSGKNWWCVMYPPMCLPAAAPKQEKVQDLQSLNAKPHYKMAFATVEIAQKLKERLEKQKQAAAK